MAYLASRGGPSGSVAAAMASQRGGGSESPSARAGGGGGPKPPSSSILDLFRSASRQGAQFGLSYGDIVDVVSRAGASEGAATGKEGGKTKG